MGIYTDDTQYALCCIQSILETGTFQVERTIEVFAAMCTEKSSLKGQRFGLFRGVGESGKSSIKKVCFHFIPIIIRS